MSMKNRKYFFILGSNPTLSMAELSAVFGLGSVEDTKCPSPLRQNGYGVRVGHLVSGDVFILESENEIKASELIKRVGGTIKIGEIVAEATKSDYQALLAGIKPQLSPGSGKFKFGFSYYGPGKFRTDKLAMDIKKHLREMNLNSRWVTSREKTLSSVVVEQNKLVAGGIEVVFIADGNNLMIGKTLAVQPFKTLSFRDYGRPARDDRSGMLPPKLAQIMINLALSISENHIVGATSTSRLQYGLQDIVILDPFCGSGTILTEAMLMGYENLIGADISEKAVKDTTMNIKWTEEEFGMRNSECGIYIQDASRLSELIPLHMIDAIVTEPYLGPQRGKIDTARVIKELEGLYSRSLSEFRKVLKPGGRVVIIFPVFTNAAPGRRGLQTAPSDRHLRPDLGGFRIVNPVPKELRGHKAIKLTERNTIVYGREGQKVWREVVVLELPRKD